MRKTVIFNEGWRFVKTGSNLEEVQKAAGEVVAFPHTWNAFDGQDGGNDYYRGRCWYIKRFPRPEGNKVFIQFNGVNSIAEVYVNGVFAARHEGGYSIFRRYYEVLKG